MTYLIPTIVPDEDGFLVKYSNDDAVQLFKDGKNPEVGVFDSVEAADTFAKQRSHAGGRFPKKVWEGTTADEFKQIRLRDR